ncbi:hypothetical protein OSH11_03895 [Kaistia dalseonensis]|uniref:Lipoprotein n=1 Tax=Kaistia dalseonensis TaxID=410840 RepID=A0ABU0H266_9HYPH|nr:hypothetical protein [Kaistia dalseonensis]MCX5493839.1 hypothetical protein [Kaistia dalseonensis]MDQ0436404.1 hypothetical protein [Kaistia dalseonensis]
MRNLLIAALCVGSLSGCYIADMKFVEVKELGYRNNARYEAGYLFLWDTRSNKLVQLADDIPLTAKPNREPPATIVASDIQGIQIEGGTGSEATKIAIAAEVGRSLQFKAENLIRERYDSVYTGLTAAYLEGQARGENLRERWYVSDATKPRSPYYYVVITGVIRTDKTVLTTAGANGTDSVASVSVTAPGLGVPVKVAIRNGSSYECSGKSAACFFKVTILKPYINEKGGLDYKPALNADVSKLPEAFRGQQ